MILRVMLCAMLLGPGTASGVAAAPLRPVVLDLEPYAGRLRTLEVRLDGKAYAFLFDSGGGFSFVTPELARDLGREPWGRVTGWRSSGERFDVSRVDPVTYDLEGRYEVTCETAVMDLAALLPEGLPPLGGLLSLHTFADEAVTLDLSTNRLIIESETSLRDRVMGVERMDMRVNHQTGGASLDVFFAILTPQSRRLWVEMDCANLGVFVLAPHAAKLLGVLPETRDGVEVWPETFPITLQVPGLGPVSTVARVEDIIYDGLCSEAFLAGLTVTLDLRRNLMWARPAQR